MRINLQEIYKYLRLQVKLKWQLFCQNIFVILTSNNILQVLTYIKQSNKCIGIKYCYNTKKSE